MSSIVYIVCRKTTAVAELIGLFKSHATITSCDTGPPTDLITNFVMNNL